MKILVLGGTQFVGRHIVEGLLSAGHEVTLFNRGKSADELPGPVERLRGDRDQGPSGLDALVGRKWDTCIDVSGYTATHVRSSAELLCGNIGHYVFISAVSVYGDPPVGPVDESFSRYAPADESATEIVDGETYGRLKVTCENIVEELFGDRCTLLRPQVVAGPHDPEDRFSYWVRRATLDDEMLAPGDGSDFVQVIDARDVARFVTRVCEHTIHGQFNLAGKRVAWSDFLQALGARNVVWVPSEILRAEGLTEFDLPLYRKAGSARSSLMHVSNARAMAAGLQLTDTAITARDVRASQLEKDLEPALSREREAAVICSYRKGK